MMLAFGVACIAVYAINAWAEEDAKPRYADAVGISMMLCVSYGLSNLLVAIYGLPDAINAFPVMDAIFSFMTWRAWKRHKTAWKLGVLSLLVAQLTLHALFITSWKIAGLNEHELYGYILLVNVLFAGQLLTVGGAGLGHVLARACHWLLDFRRHHMAGGAQ